MESVTLQTSQTEKFQTLSVRNDRRNFRLGVTNGVLYGLGTYFISRTTVIPSFFSHLTHSSALIGLVSQFESIGWYLPQFFAAAFVLHLPKKLPLYRIGWWVRGSALFALAIVTLLAPNPGLLLLLAILLYGTFAFGAGLSGVVFLELVAKTIPANRRGRFFGLRLTMSSLFSISIGAVAISLMLAHFHFPVNFGFVFLTGAAIVTVGLGFMAFMREPRSRNMPDERTLIEHIKEGYRVYKQDRRFKEYLHARLIMGTWTIGVPFLVLFAHDKLGFQTSDLGLFIAADCIGTVAGNFLWERLTDTVSAKACLEASTIVAAVLPVIVLLYLWLPLPPILYASVFALAAAFDAGTSIGGMSYIIEIAPEHDRATHIGLFNSLMAVPCLLTAVAGALLDLTGFGVLYGIVLAIAIVSFFEVRKLRT